MASNLESSMSQHTIATYVARASGGEASIENGGAWLMDVKGNSVHSGFSPEVLEMSVVETGEAGHITLRLVGEHDLPVDQPVHLRPDPARAHWFGPDGNRCD